MRWLRALSRKAQSDTDTVLRRVNLKGIPLKIYDYRSSTASEVIKNELEADCYGIEQISFLEGDVVVDIGGHVGMFSIYLARRFPYVKIYAFEPIPQNYQHFVKNIEANRVTNVDVIDKAVTCDGRPLEMLAHRSNTGGATAQLRDMQLADHVRYRVDSVTLDGIFETRSIVKCRLLKIDCEGSEYEILLNAKCLNRVEYLSGEFHINQHLADRGYSIEGLHDYCRHYVPADHIHYTACHMTE
jgi:FkbM family methyltransferase